MLKRAVAIMLSTAFLATTSAAIVIAPATQAEAAAAKAKPPAMSFRERQKACSAEWKEAKAAQKTKGMKWPKFWSDCNKRMKAKSA